jgi:hypothetical protein
VSAKLAAALATAAALLSAIAPGTAAANGHRSGFGIGHPLVRETMIACFDAKTHLSVAKIEPWDCDFAGHLEFAGRLEGRSTKNVADGSFARFPVKGEFDRIEWLSWGVFKTWGLQAVSARTGKPTKVHLYRRIRCPDGTTWYSRASVSNPATGYEFVVRLPICDEVATAGRQ